MTYDLDPPELDELENPLLWPTGLDDPLPTDEEAEHDPYYVPDPFYDDDPPDDDPGVNAARRAYHDRKARSQR